MHFSSIRNGQNSGLFRPEGAFCAAFFWVSRLFSTGAQGATCIYFPISRHKSMQTEWEFPNRQMFA
jgi:hypothetical protein